MYNEQTGMYEGFIYCITNLKNGKKYIGQTITTVEHRWGQHKSSVKTRSCVLYKAMDKYGVENFKVEQLEIISCINEQELKNKLNILEKEYIFKYDTLCKSNGYNMTIGGDSCSERLKKPVDMYDLNGNFIRSFSSSNEASLYLNTSAAWILDCCKGKVISVHGHVFRFKGEAFNKHKLVSKRSKTYYKFDLNGNIVDIYNSETQAHKNNGITKSKFRNAVADKISIDGYYYSTDNTIDLNLYKVSHQRDRKIGMYDKDTHELLRIFQKLSYAREFLGRDNKIDSALIRACKDFNKIAYGYRWKYLD